MKSPVRQPLIVIAGPTGSGKTELGIAVARQFGGEVICADARTIYRQLDIGTAKPEGLPIPGGRLVEGIPHYLLDIVDPDQSFSLVEFQKMARATLQEIRSRGKLPVVLGGTGLYIRALLYAYKPSAVLPDPVWRTMAASLPLEVMQQRLVELVGEVPARFDFHNPHRLIRAIEVARVTGQLPVVDKQPELIERDCLYLGIKLPREVLYDRINRRVEAMIESGWIGEVKNLVKKYGSEAPGLTSIGYRELIVHLQEAYYLPTVISQIQQATRHYAKRQLTWLRREKDLQWVKPEAVDVVVREFLGGE